MYLSYSNVSVVRRIEGYVSVFSEWLAMLGNLVSSWQIPIVVVFAVEEEMWSNCCAVENERST